MSWIELIHVIHKDDVVTNISKYDLGVPNRSIISKIRIVDIGSDYFEPIQLFMEYWVQLGAKIRRILINHKLIQKKPSTVNKMSNIQLNWYIQREL